MRRRVPIRKHCSAAGYRWCRVRHDQTIGCLRSREMSLCTDQVHLASQVPRRWCRARRALSACRAGESRQGCARAGVLTAAHPEARLSFRWVGAIDNNVSGGQLVKDHEIGVAHRRSLPLSTGRTQSFIRTQSRLCMCQASGTGRYASIRLCRRPRVRSCTRGGIVTLTCRLRWWSIFL